MEDVLAGIDEVETNALDVRLRACARACTECGACVRQCAFLQKHGTPKSVAEVYDRSDPAHLEMPFECSLCGLCTAVCPEGVDPCDLFLELRRESVRRGAGDFREHRSLRRYEERGTSKRYTCYVLPEACEDVLFPGCALSGTRALRVLQVLGLLRRESPRVGIVLDCCSMPSHDLGRDREFRARFGEMREYLVGKGVRRVLLACPNCFKVFQRYGDGLEVRTVYEVLAEAPLPREGVLSGSITVHDPCPVRFDARVQAAARRLLERMGLRVEEMKNAGRLTLCCGEGGAVEALSRELADAWGERRARQAEGRRVATYCAGCAHQLSRHAPTSHVLDLVLDPAAAMAGHAQVTRAPFTYLARLRLKRKLRRLVNAAESRERREPRARR